MLEHSLHNLVHKNSQSITCRIAISVSGIVQGVGFRPFIHSLASRLKLGGFIRNQRGGVLIEIEGKSESLNLFLNELTFRPPSLAHIVDIQSKSCAPQGERLFQIEPSINHPMGAVFIS